MNSKEHAIQLTNRIKAREILHFVRARVGNYIVLLALVHIFFHLFPCASSSPSPSLTILFLCA